MAGGPSRSNHPSNRDPPLSAQLCVAASKTPLNQLEFAFGSFSPCSLICIRNRCPRQNPVADSGQTVVDVAALSHYRRAMAGRLLPLLLPLWTLLAVVPVFAQDQDDPLSPPAAMTTTAGDIFGDEDGVPLTFRGLFQTRYGQTWPASMRAGERALVQSDDGWRLERAFLRAASKPLSWLGGKVLLDFASLRDGNATQTVKLAYAEVDVTSRVRLTTGLFKRSYSLLELLPIAEYEFADTGVADTLIQDTGFGGRDFGAMISVQPLPKKRWLKAMVGAFQGGHFSTDGRADGLLTARLESTPLKHVHLGADLAWRRGANDPSFKKKLIDGPQVPGWAWSADVMLQYERWEVRAEALGGDRTDVNHRLNPDFGANAEQFLGAWLVGVARIPLGSALLMPALRVEWLDADRDRAVGNRLLVATAMNVEFSQRVRLLIDLSRQVTEQWTMPVGSTPNGDQDVGVWRAFYEPDYWRLVTQLQIRL